MNQRKFQLHRITSYIEARRPAELFGTALAPPRDDMIGRPALGQADRDRKRALSAARSGRPGGPVRGERANFTRLVLGCIEAKFCK